MGDFNAKIGSDIRGYEEIMRQHGLEEMNDSGERFAQLCALSKMAIEWECLPPQKDSQGNLGITWPLNREPDGPCLHRVEV